MHRLYAANSCSFQFRLFVDETSNGFSSTLPNPVIPNIATANAGLYNVTITDEEGCTEEQSITITVLPSPTPA
ncbi:MAG: hypothetical protein R2795_14715 [Saprospiraceae bacterium]